MNAQTNTQTARNLMSVHGLRAQAVAHERLLEARASGDAAGMERWQAVEAAIAEVRRTTGSNTTRH